MSEEGVVLAADEAAVCMRVATSSRSSMKSSMAWKPAAAMRASLASMSWCGARPSDCEAMAGRKRGAMMAVVLSFSSLQSNRRIKESLCVASVRQVVKWELRQ